MSARTDTGAFERGQVLLASGRTPVAVYGDLEDIAANDPSDTGIQTVAANIHKLDQLRGLDRIWNEGHILLSHAALTHLQ